MVKEDTFDVWQLTARHNWKSQKAFCFPYRPRSVPVYS